MGYNLSQLIFFYFPINQGLNTLFNQSILSTYYNANFYCDEARCGDRLMYKVVTVLVNSKWALRTSSHSLLSSSSRLPLWSSKCACKEDHQTITFVR